MNRIRLLFLVCLFFLQRCAHPTCVWIELPKYRSIHKRSERTSDSSQVFGLPVFWIVLI